MPKNCTGLKMLTASLPGLVRFHRALAAHADVGAQRHVDAFPAELPLALHEREITLLHLAVAHQRVQRAQRRGLARNQQQAAGVAIDAMNQLEVSSGRAARSASMTPKLTPLPPCTATPAGLSMTSSRGSS